MSEIDKQKIYEEEKARFEAQERLKKEKKEKESKQGCIGCFGLIVLIILFSAFSSSCGSSKTDSSAAKPPTNSVEQVQPPSLGFKGNQFVEKFNATAAKLESSLKAPQVSIKTKEKYDEFYCEFNENLVVSGTMNKQDNSVRNLIMLGRGDGTPSSGARILLCMATLIVMMNPELSPEERGNLLKELNVTMETPDKTTKEAVRGNIKYGFGIAKDVGVLFTISHVNDK